MKKKVTISLLILFLISILIANILIINKKEKVFYLENSYYGKNNMTEININELNKLIDNKESFAVFVYQPLCITSTNFESILKDFLEENKISIYKIAFSNIKNTKIGKTIKYYPSFIIYNKGKMIDFLEANKDEDIKYYTSKKEFESWFTKYIKIKNETINNNQTTRTSSKAEENEILTDVKIENIIKENNKVNIYFFWGKGCPHCAKEFEFFESIKETYGNYYNLYTFETWYNDENKKLVYTFAENMGDKLTGVPYTIIGNKSFSGFDEKYKNDFIIAIENQYKSNFDIYFDKIKK